MSRTLLPRALRAVSVTTLLIGSFVAVPTALAAPPTKQTLNPPAPDFYDCRPVGSGTICHGTQTNVIDPAPTDITCGTGATAFEVFDQGIEEQLATRVYDRDGNLTRRVLHVRWLDAQWSNPLTGKIVPYTQSNTITDVLATPGDFSSSTQTNVGQNIFRTSTGGHPVLFSVGRFVVGPGDELLSSSGHQWAVELFFLGNPGVLDAVCSALA